MQRFERSREPPPAVFASPQADRNRRILRDFLLSDARKRAQSSVPRTMLPLEETSVVDALGRLFRGKCAFCEARVETRPHRFRPPGEARPHVRSDAGHLYYVWLADAWENIYPICRTCGDQEPDYFPVRDRRAPLPTAEQLNRFVDEGIGLWRGHPPQERPLLLDPCGRGEVYGDIHVELSGKLSPRSQTGFETIQQFNLNHRDRVQARGYVYGERLERLISFLTEPHRPDQTIEDLFAFDELEFGGTWFLVLRRLVLATRRPGERRPVVSKSGIARQLLQLYGMADAFQRLRTAVDQLIEEDTHEPVRPEPPRGRTSRARLIHVAIDNFKSLERIDLVMPEPRAPGEGKVTVPVPSVLILGENSAGKSSLLEAIALALADPEARVAIDLAVDRLPLNPGLMGAKPDQHRRVAKIILRFDDTRTHSLVIDDGRYSDMGQLTASMPPVFAYGAFRHYADRQRRHSADRYVKSLFGGDSLLSNPERWLLRLDEDRFDMVVRALRDILSVEGEFEVIRRDFQESRCVIVTRMPAPDGGHVDVETPLAIASSGFRSVLAMVCDVFQGLMDDRVHEEFETLTSARAVVLIDEVEAHLHPRWKMQIMRGLRSALPAITFIATTHDPLCLRGMDDGEVRVMQKVPGDQVAGTRLPVFVEQLRDLPLMSQLTLEQLLTSDLFQMYSTDAPEADERLAAIADLLTRQRAGEILAPTDQEVLTQFDADIAAALPVGSSEVHRLVQDAVAIYLRERRAASQTRMNELRTAARDKIVAVLRDV